MDIVPNLDTEVPIPGGLPGCPAFFCAKNKQAFSIRRFAANGACCSIFYSFKAAKPKLANF